MSLEAEEWTEEELAELRKAGEDCHASLQDSIEAYLQSTPKGGRPEDFPDFHTWLNSPSTRGPSKSSATALRLLYTALDTDTNTD